MLYKPFETRLIMVVAQEPFEVDFNQFCKLIPLVFVDGTLADTSDFPNDGEIWWMLTTWTAKLAQPGHLVIGSVVDASGYDEDDPTSSQYQAQRESVRDMDIRDGLEVIEIPDDATDSIQDVVSKDFQLKLLHRPTPSVVLRWRSDVYGPFSASSNIQEPGKAAGEFSFTPTNQDMTVFQLRAEDFTSATAQFCFTLSSEVSLTPHRRAENFRLVRIKHELVLAQGYERILARNPQKIVLEPIEKKLLRFARQCMTRGKRKELRGLLEELDVSGRETQEAEELSQGVGIIKQITERQDAALDEVANALLKSGVLGEDRIRKAEQKYAEQYVQEHTAALQAKLQENLAVMREELREVEAKLKDIQSRLQIEEMQQRAKLEDSLETERREAQERIAAEREDFEKQKAELDRQEKLLQRNLEQVTKDLREAGDEVVNRFLTIAPLLGSVGLMNRAPSGESSSTSANDDAVETAKIPFEIPAFIIGPATSTEGDLTEDAFFDRFSRTVENSGFTYHKLDLKRFHLSVKCGELTVVGGPSGTGKSSLPLLYSQALLGDEAGSGRPGCLMVNINPSWMDIRDLIGHMNTLEGKFYPAESGLFQYLVYAQEEYRSRESMTGLYLTCLDEMNLSQVEHYFSDFMMVLERSGSSRTIQCFSKEVAGASCPFREWGTIIISPAVKFVGTVNFDETTRLLSDRFLDRVNLINLTSESLPAVSGERTGALARATGPMVTLADFERWLGNDALPSDLGSLMDSMRPILHQLGCPISPRVYRAICRFVGSAVPLLTRAKAFDVQIAQRVVPRIRSLVARRQHEALDNLMRLLNASSVCPFDETIPLLENIRESTVGSDWILEEE